MKKYDLSVTELTPQNRELFESITNLIHHLGIPANMRGHNYIRSALLLSVFYPDIIYKVTTVLYPLLGEKYGVSAYVIEKNIRSCIERAWGLGDSDSLYNVFRGTIDPNKGKPSNAEFLAMLADIIIIECAKSE